MTPARYMQDIVLPTVREFLAKPADRRLAYIAAQVTYHVVDYLMRTSVPVGAKRPIREAEMLRIEGLIQRACPEAFAVVEGMCHGSKHCGRDGRKGQPFTPGDEQETLQFGFGRRAGIGGWGVGQWGPKRLYLDLDGRMYVVDAAIKAFIVATVEAFPDELGHVLPNEPRI